MGDCKENMTTKSKTTESFLDKFKKKISSKKSKAKKDTKTLVDMLADLSDSIDRLKINKSEEAAEIFVQALDEASERAESLVSTKEKDLDTEKDKFEENLQKLAILKEIRYHIDEAVEMAVLKSEKIDKQSEILKQIQYHIEEAAELTIGYKEAA